jgi:hypothetical protein
LWTLLAARRSGASNQKCPPHRPVRRAQTPRNPASAATARLTKETNVKLQPKNAYEPEPVEVERSPNRKALATLNAARAKAAAEVAELQERLNRLADLKGAVAPLEDELAALDAKEAAALAQWSATPDAPAPEPDIAARDAIMARLQAARQRIAGAEQATASVEHVLNTANARYADLEHQVPALVANVLIDEARALLPPIVEATLALAKAKGRFAGLRSFLLDRAEAAKDVAMRGGFFQELEKLDREAADAASIGPLSFSAGNEWREVADALGDTPHRPTPTMPAAFAGMPEFKW